MKYFQIKLCCQRRKYYWGSYVKKFFCSATFFNMSKTVRTKDHMSKDFCKNCFI